MPKSDFEPRNYAGVLIFKIPLWEEKFPELYHAFSTRMGGVSDGERATMNLRFKRADSAAVVRENYRRLTAAAAAPYEGLVLTRQVHGDAVLAVRDRSLCGRGLSDGDIAPEYDGLMTDLPGVTLVKHFADCVPLFFYDPVHRVAAISHAGWRGTVQRIGGKTIQSMGQTYGSRPQDIYCAIGPSIGPCCFEVDAPVRDAFAQSYGGASPHIHEDGNGKFHIDLQACNREDMLQNGIPASQIAMANLCTSCDPETFYSHRRDRGHTGTLAGLIGIRG